MMISTRGLSKAFLRVLIVVSLFCVVWPVAASELKAISLYGLSTHNDDNDGKGYEEFNYGVSVHFGESRIADTIDFSAQLGVFRNSYDDLAVWAGGELSFTFSERIIPTLDFRHWETKRKTYQKRAIVVYPKLRFRINDKTTVDWLIRRSGYIFSYRIDLK